MSGAAAIETADRPSGLFRKIRWHWRHDPKIELWISWWSMVVFYQLFGIVFVLMARVMPPPKPYWDHARIVQWFHDNHTGLLFGFGIIFLVAGLNTVNNAIIAYSMRRMSVSKAFAYSYILIYALATIPGMLYCGIFLSVGAMRPDRDPTLIAWLYDAGLLTFIGTLGIFFIGTLVWMIAILIDKNGVLPKWFGYLNIANLVTEVVVSPCWIMKSGAFAWNGSIAFWVDTAVFVVYTAAFITLLRKMVVREDFGDGPLPDGPNDEPADMQLGLAQGSA